MANTQPREKRIAQKGYGYYETTIYPYGGDFKRFTEDTVVEIIGPAGKYPKRELSTSSQIDEQSARIPIFSYTAHVNWYTNGRARTHDSRPYPMPKSPRWH